MHYRNEVVPDSSGFGHQARFVEDEIAPYKSHFDVHAKPVWHLLESAEVDEEESEKVVDNQDDEEEMDVLL